MKRYIRIHKSQFDMYRPKYTLFKMKWDFHKTDDDCNPSVPHGHSVDGRYKMSIWDGKVYDVRTRKLCGSITRKEIENLHNDAVFMKFVDESREWYKSTHPHYPDEIPYINTGEYNQAIRGNRCSIANTSECLQIELLASIRLESSRCGFVQIKLNG